MHPETQVRRLPLAGLMLVALGQLAMITESPALYVRAAFFAAMVFTLFSHLVPIRVTLSRDRARVFVTVGILGYVAFGFRDLDPFSHDPHVDRFLTGLVLVFTVHQLGALFRLGKGGTVGPVYVVSAIQMLGAANAQEESWRIPWLIGAWMILGAAVMWIESRPRDASGHPVPGRRRFLSRPALILIGMVAVIAPAVSLSLPPLQRAMQNWQVLSAQGSGLAGLAPSTTKLGLVQRLKQSPTKVMRVYGDLPPDLHLRSMVYTHFDGREERWAASGTEKLDRHDHLGFVPATEDTGGGYRHGPLAFPGAWEGEEERMDIWLFNGFHAISRPAPLGTRHAFSERQESLYQNPSGILQAHTDEARHAFRNYGLEVVFETAPELSAHQADSSQVLSPAEHDACLASADVLPEFARRKAAELVNGGGSPLQAIRRVEQWFSSSGEFEYSLEVPRNHDLASFLEPGGHVGWCEYYATAMTLMLRSEGIPARYVTGHVAGEWNAIGGYTIVRAWDAHAWVEAYVPGLGWRTFDPTPPDFRRPANPQTDFLAGLWDWITSGANSVWQRLQQGDVLGALRALVVGLGTTLRGLLYLVLHPFVAIPLALFALAFGARSWRRRSRTESGLATHPPTTAAAVAAAWERAEAEARQRGVAWPRGSTPRQALAHLEAKSDPLAPRLAPLVELIYSHRYRDQAVDDDTVTAATARLGE